MSANKHQPHLLVIPEDKANQDIINGFRLRLEFNARQLHVLDLSNGWPKGTDRLLGLSSDYLIKHNSAHALLVVDHDGNPDRGCDIKAQISEEVIDRVFVLGALSEPEELKRATRKKYEQIGSLIADGYKADDTVFWQQTLLAHNLDEVRRLSKVVRDLFLRCSKHRLTIGSRIGVWVYFVLAMEKSSCI